jgi:hypothetical protein
VDIFDEIMLIKISIDLNFLSVCGLTYQTLGFIDTEPLEFHFYLNDTKMMNYNEDELKKISSFSLLSHGLISIDSYQNSNPDKEKRFKKILELIKGKWIEEAGIMG